MSTTRKPSFSAAASITITLASLGNGSYRQSAAVDNSTNLYNEAFCNGKFKTGASGTSATGSFQVFPYASYDGGTSYTHGASGSDASYTPDLSFSLIPVQSVGGGSLANATTYFWDFHIVAAQGWSYLPKSWGLIVLNNCGSALDSTGGNFLNQYAGVNDTFV